MVRKVFYSFNYEKDGWRAGQVYGGRLTESDIDVVGFVGVEAWEGIKRQGEEAVNYWIEENLNETSVTAILIGAETATKQWVLDTIQQSYLKRNGLLGIYIHNLRDSTGNTSIKGQNPFEKLYIEENGQKIPLSQLYPTYDWIIDDGYNNLGVWVEEAAKREER
jgi:hypothetical protein